MGKVMTMRMDDNRLEVINHFAKEEGIPKSRALREIFDYGRVDVAVRMYVEGKASLEKAAKLAGVSISEMMDILAERGVELNVSLDDFRESLKNARMLAKSH